jgi:pilus assembly protein CpaE
VMEFTRRFKSIFESSSVLPAPRPKKVGLVEGAIGGNELIDALSRLFPDVAFESIGASWPDFLPPHFDILVAAVDSSSPADMDAAIRKLKRRAKDTQVVVILRNADVDNARLLTREGATDVLPAPVSEPALALCFERILTRGHQRTGGGRGPGQVVALLKAGGGVGATSLGVQVAKKLASQPGRSGNVCLADFDLQFGNAALYFDLNEALTISDCLAAGEALEDTHFIKALAVHNSGARVLAAPRELTALETLTPALVNTLVSGLKRDFALTILDLPSVWTSWTNRALHLADRIVLVTELSVAHVHLARRQINVLALQKLDDRPLIMVCNKLTSEQQGSLSRKAAERAMGHAFDVIIPEDSRVMNAAINQGLQLSAIRRGTRIEKAIEHLAHLIAANALSGVSAQHDR